MASRRLSFSLILGIVATPMMAAPTADNNTQKRSEDNVKETASAIHPQNYYSNLVDLLSPSPWDLNVPGGVEDLTHVFYLRSPRQVEFEQSNDDLETAEQILFRPLFRHRQLIAERVQRLREKEALRRRLFSVEDASQLSSVNINGIEDRFFNSRQERSVRPLIY